MCSFCCCCLVAKLCWTLCDPMDCSPPGSSVHGILQAKILEWVAMSLSRGSSWPKDQTCISCIVGGFFTAELPGKPNLGMLVVKNLPINAGDSRDAGSVPGGERSPGGGHDNPLQYSCLENPMDRGAWRAMVHRVTKSQTCLKQLSTHTRTIHKSYVFIPLDFRLPPVIALESPWQP